MKAVVLLVLALAGCGSRRNNDVDAFLDPPCLTEPIQLKACDSSKEPMKCKEIRARYRRGCARIQPPEPPKGVEVQVK